MLKRQTHRTEAVRTTPQREGSVFAEATVGRRTVGGLVGRANDARLKASRYANAQNASA